MTENHDSLRDPCRGDFPQNTPLFAQPDLEGVEEIIDGGDFVFEVSRVVSAHGMPGGKSSAVRGSTSDPPAIFSTGNVVANAFQRLLPHFLSPDRLHRRTSRSDQ